MSDYIKRKDATAISSITGGYATSSISVSQIITDVRPWTATICDHAFTDFIPESKKYRCSYCGVVHEDREGVCDCCGAPLGEAEEV